MMLDFSKPRYGLSEEQWDRLRDFYNRMMSTKPGKTFNVSPEDDEPFSHFMQLYGEVFPMTQKDRQELEALVDRIQGKVQ